MSSWHAPSSPHHTHGSVQDVNMYLEEIDSLREENARLQENIDQVESILAKMEEDSMTQQQAMLDQGNLRKMLENKVANLEQQLLGMASGDHTEHLKVINQEQQTIIEDLRSQLTRAQAHMALSSDSTDLQIAVQERDAEIEKLNATLRLRDGEIERLTQKLATLHEQATGKVNKANGLLRERDSKIQQLLSLVHAAQKSPGSQSIDEVVSHLQDLQARISELQSECATAKRSLHEQQEEFEEVLSRQAKELTDQFQLSMQEHHNEYEQLMAKQAEEMTNEFESSLRMLKTELEEEKSAYDQLEQQYRTELQQTQKQEEQLQSQTSEIMALQNRFRDLDAIEEHAKRMGVDMSKMEKEISMLRGDLEKSSNQNQELKQQLHSHTIATDQEITKLKADLESSIRERQGLEEQLQLQTIAADKQLQDAKQQLQGEMQRAKSDFQREYEQLKSINKKMSEEGDRQMKMSWEYQDRNQALTQELEDKSNSLEMKDKTLGKLSTELETMQESYNTLRAKKDRMEDVIMTQEIIIQDGKNEAENLRTTIVELQQAVDEKTAREDLKAYEELALVTKKLQILEGENEAMKDIIKSLPGDMENSPQMKKFTNRVQRSAMPPKADANGEMVVHELSQEVPVDTLVASSDLQLAQLEMKFRKEKERADSAEHELAQLKVDLVMYEERNNGMSSDNITSKKAGLMQEMIKTKEACRAAEELAERLQQELAEMKRAPEVFEEPRASPSNHLLERRLLEAQNASHALQRRLDLVFKENNALEERMAVVQKEKRMALDRVEKVKSDFQNIRMEMNDLQKEANSRGRRVEELEEENVSLRNEVSGLRTMSNTLEQEAAKFSVAHAELQNTFQKFNELERKHQHDIMTKTQELDACLSEKKQLQIHRKNAESDIQTQISINEELQMELNRRVDELSNLQADFERMSRLLEVKTADHKDLQKSIELIKNDKEEEAQQMITKVKNLEDFVRVVQGQRDDMQILKASQAHELAECKGENIRLTELLGSNTSLISQMKNDSDSLCRTRFELEQRLSKCTTERDEAKNKVVELQARVDALEVERGQDMLARRKESSDLERVCEERSQLKAQLSSLEAQLEHSKQQYERDTKSLRDQVNDYLVASDEVTAELQLLQVDLKQAAEKISVRDDQIQKRDGDIQTLNATIKSLQGERHSFKLDAEYLRNSKKKADEDVAVLTERLSTMTQKLNEASNDLKTLQLRIDTLEKEKRIVAEQHELYFSSSQSSTKDLEDTNKQVQVKLDTLAAELESAVAEKQGLTDLFDKEREEWHKKQNSFSTQLMSERKRHTQVESDLRGQLQKTKAEYETVKVENAERAQALRDSNTKHDEECEHLKRRLAQLEQELADQKQCGKSLKERTGCQIRTLQEAVDKAQKESLIAERSVQDHISDVSILKDKIKQLKEELSSHTVRRASCENELSACKLQLLARDSQIRSLEDDVLELQRAKKMNEELSKDNSNLLVVNNDLREEVGKVTSQKDLLEQKVHELQRHLDSARADLESHDQRLSSAEMEIESLNKEKQSKGKEYVKILADFHALKCENTNFNDAILQLEHVKTKSLQLEQELTDYQSQLKQSQLDSDSLKKKLEAAQAEVMRLSNGTVNGSNDNAETFQSENEKLNSKVKNAEEQVRAIQKSRTDLMKQLSEVQAENMALKAQLAGEGTGPPCADVLKSQEEQIQELLSQREIMVNELSERKILLESAMKEAEETVSLSEKGMAQKISELNTLRSELQRQQIEISMHQAEKEALIDDRTKLQRQLMATRGDIETLQEKLCKYEEAKNPHTVDCPPDNLV